MSDKRFNKRADAIFNFIIQFKTTNDGRSPTIREIAAGCTIPSTSVVNYHLQRLSQAGRITLNGQGQTRQITVPGGQWVYKGVINGTAQ